MRPFHRRCDVVTAGNRLGCFHVSEPLENSSDVHKDKICCKVARGQFAGLARSCRVEPTEKIMHPTKFLLYSKEFRFRKSDLSCLTIRSTIAFRSISSSASSARNRSLAGFSTA